jgi:hypothetical protein
MGNGYPELQTLKQNNYKIELNYPKLDIMFLYGKINDMLNLNPIFGLECLIVPRLQIFPLRNYFLPLWTCVNFLDKGILDFLVA